MQLKFASSHGQNPMKFFLHKCQKYAPPSKGWKKRKLKLIISAFEQISEFKISFHKGKLSCFGKAKTRLPFMLSYLAMGKASSIRYLCNPIHYRRLMNVEWKHVEKRLHERLRSWKRKLLSIGKRLVLLNLILRNMVLFMIYFFLVPKKFCID
jgi:hypothetical protein